jgi:PTEN induced putative kinase 1
LTRRVFGGIRNVFQNAFLKRANSNSQAGIWRRKTAKQLLTGNATPFLALVGVTLASGPGIVTKQDELEFVCKEIQRSARKTLNSYNDEYCTSQTEYTNQTVDIDCSNTASNSTSSWSLSDFVIGSVIAKGCNAVVKAARFKDSVLEKMSAFQTNFQAAGLEENYPSDETMHTKASCQSAGNEDAIQKLERNTNEDVNQTKKSNSVKETVETNDLNEYPLAIKQMFNYDVESNAQVIFRAMYREIVIARDSSLPDEIAEWSRGLHSRKKTLPPHPNIVEMPLAFADYIPNSSEAMELYPDALPQRLNPDGVGRNMSLFLVMKRYDCTLREFLQSLTGEKEKLNLSWKTSLVLLTQLLEGIMHMVENEIAHRDLKSDNILINRTPSYDTMGKEDTPSSNYQFPHLVISDFGCCLADSKVGLKLPFTSFETDRGGNVALMAPEVKNAEPGMFSSIDYSKSDVWSAGAIAYELFGAPNPFYGDRKINPKGVKRNVFNR